MLNEKTNAVASFKRGAFFFRQSNSTFPFGILVYIRSSELPNRIVFPITHPRGIPKESYVCAVLTANEPQTPYESVFTLDQIMETSRNSIEATSSTCEQILEWLRSGDVVIGEREPSTIQSMIMFAKEQLAF